MPLVNIEINKVRLLLPFYQLNSFSVKNKNNYQIIVAQIYSLNLTSQVENPIIRNFIKMIFLLTNNKKIKLRICYIIK